MLDGQFLRLFSQLLNILHLATTLMYENGIYQRLCKTEGMPQATGKCYSFVACGQRPIRIAKHPKHQGFMDQARNPGIVPVAKCVDMVLLRIVEAAALL